MRQSRGFSLIEIIIALAVTLIALVAFLTVFSNSNDHALQSRNRSVAILIAQSLMDDIETHTYGDPEPLWWKEDTDQPVSVWLGDRPQEMIFHKEVSFENGSFVGTGSEAKDLVTITLTWREKTGDDQSATTSDNKELKVRVPVWR